MEEIKLTPKELKEAIDTGKYINTGSEGSLFTYKGRIIKMDQRLYSLLKVNDPRFANDEVISRYRWERDDFADRNQLEELAKRQPLIRPKVPEGIITLTGVDRIIDGVSPGIIIPYFEDYKLFGEISKEDYLRLLILLKKVFDDLRNLADYEIAHEDLYEYHSTGNHYNIMQKGNDPQLIDMSGQLIKVGKDFEGPDKMYKDFANLINYYNKLYGFDQLYLLDNHITEEKLQTMLNEFENNIHKNKRL